MLFRKLVPLLFITSFVALFPASSSAAEVGCGLGWSGMAVDTEKSNCPDQDSSYSCAVACAHMCAPVALPWVPSFEPVVLAVTPTKFGVAKLETRAMRPDPPPPRFGQ